MMNFCDFCPCEECRNGVDGLSHAQTKEGKWICDICYTYDVCTSGPNRSRHGPCETEYGTLNPNCVHRPILVTGWIDWAEKS